MTLDGDVDRRPSELPIPMIVQIAAGVTDLGGAAQIVGDEEHRN